MTLLRHLSCGATGGEQKRMPYSYTEHVSDIGIRAEGASIEEAFEAGIEAALAVMFDPSTVGCGTAVVVEASAPEVDLLFVEAINEVISIIGRDRLSAARATGARVERVVGGEGFTFTATVMAEPFDACTHEVRTEVKGATYSGLRYHRGERGEHVLECVLDI